MSEKTLPTFGGVTIESVTKCFGNCDGCLLTEQQRHDDETNKQAPMAWATSYARDALTPIDTSLAAEGAFLILGQGEHLEVDPVETVIDWVDASMPHANGVSEFTTALLMPNARVKDLIQRMYRRSLEVKQQMLPNIVFSPKKVIKSGFAEKYLENIATTIETFGACDLTLNIGPDVVDLLTPQGFHDMIVASGLKQIEINLVPTPESAPRMAPRYLDMINWLKTLGRVWLDDPERYYVPYMMDLAQFAEERYEWDLQRAMDFLVFHFTRELYVTLDGKVYLSGSGGAAIVMPFSSMYGFAPAQQNFAPYDAKVLEIYAERLAKRLWVIHQRYAACRRCPHIVTCIAGGFTPSLMLMGKTAGLRDDECPLDCFELIDYAYQCGIRRNAELSVLWKKKVVQLGAATDEQVSKGDVEPGVHADGLRFSDVVRVREVNDRVAKPVTFHAPVKRAEEK